VARVFGRNDIDLRENPARALGHVPEIADGRCHHV
jgi:hypothetical protein